MGVGGVDDRIDLSALGVYLDADERLLWAGRPTRTPIALRGRDAFMIPFSLLWGGFAFVWNWLAWSGGLSGFSLFGLPFLLMGFYITVGRFLHNWWKRSRTHYVLTDRRAYISGGTIGRHVRDHSLGVNLGVETKLGRGGRGTIRFDADPGGWSRIFNTRNDWGQWSNAGLEGFQFYRIDDVAQVAQMVRSASTSLMEQRRRRDATLDQAWAQDSPGWRRPGDDSGRPDPSPWGPGPADDANR